MFEKIALGRTDLVFEFLAQGADATQTDARGMSLLRLCAYHGDPTPFVWRPNAIRMATQRHSYGDPTPFASCLSGVRA
jgi:hypothetical protein